MDEFPEFSNEELIKWLDAKYSRHGEIEDGVAAARLRSLTEKIRRITRALDSWSGHEPSTSVLIRAIDEARLEPLQKGDTE